MKTGVTNSKLQLSSAELGMFQYDLQLTATAAGPEKAVYFRAPLGGGQQQSAHFVNFAKLKTEYTCKVRGVATKQSKLWCCWQLRVGSNPDLDMFVIEEGTYKP